MRFARKSVSDKERKDYENRASNLQQSQGMGQMFRFPAPPLAPQSK